MRDVAIIGGGIIGLSSALELSNRGFTVEVRDTVERKASLAAAGILAPQSEATDASPMLDLCRKSFDLYPEFVRGLGDVGFRRNGTLHRTFSDEEARKLRAQVQWQLEAALRIEEREDGFFFPDEGQVDNRKLMAALWNACSRKGVDFVMSPDPPRVGGRPVVVCSGAWFGPPVFPVKGEMLALDAKPPEQVIFGGGGYIVPRGELTLVGATVEPHNRDATPSEKGRAYLLEVARKHGYASANVVDHWAGLRPGTPDGLPLLGKTRENLIVASGHFRNGILLAPITAKIVAALVLGETPPVDLAPFDPLRYSTIPPGGPT